MSKSIYEYVRHYEESNDNILLKDCFIVVRIDGQGFHQFSKKHDFYKPNDKRCLDLMNDSAKHVMKKYYPNIVIAYGESDEFSFVIRRLSKIFNRRQNKITSLIVSTFTSAFVYFWSKHFTNQSPQGTVGSVKLQYPPSFDGRCILYPNEKLVMDYLKWRQVDCHVNNLYNTTFYALTGQYTKYPIITNDIIIKCDNDSKPLTAREATDRLSRTSSSDKHEILFHEFGINYNNELEQFKKGTVLLLDVNQELAQRMSKIEIKKRSKNKKSEQSIEESDTEEPDLDQFISMHNIDIIGDKFWDQYKNILS